MQNDLEGLTKSQLTSSGARFEKQTFSPLVKEIRTFVVLKIIDLVPILNHTNPRAFKNHFGIVLRCTKVMLSP
jgi:hypothetical protein